VECCKDADTHHNAKVVEGEGVARVKCDDILELGGSTVKVTLLVES